MKKPILLSVLALVCLFLPAQEPSVQPAAQPSGQASDASLDPRKSVRKNMILKEWNLDVRTNKTVLDHVTTYNELGRKIEEIEYNSLGQLWRKRFEHNAMGKVGKEYIYDHRNVLVNYKVFEYNELGIKTKATTYYPNGKVKTIKTYEYSVREDSQDKSVKKK